MFSCRSGSSGCAQERLGRFPCCIILMQLAFKIFAREMGSSCACVTLQRRSSPCGTVGQLPQLPVEPRSRPEPLAHGAVRVPDLHRPLAPRQPPHATILAHPHPPPPLAHASDDDQSHATTEPEAGADTAGGATTTSGSGTLAAAGQSLAASPLPLLHGAPIRSSSSRRRWTR